ncbi:MAG: hypothetical protein IPK80_00535 [Nannocystis sp.]|nr:hypothetical protein [Nannocystis sp.]
MLGGFHPGTHHEFGLTVGQAIQKGHKLGRVLGSYGMIHLETYGDKDRKANSVWRVGNPIPRGLHNPTKYVESMVDDAPAVDDASPSPTEPAAPPPEEAPSTSSGAAPWIVGGLAVAGAAVALTYTLRRRSNP